MFMIIYILKITVLKVFCERTIMLFSAIGLQETYIFVILKFHFLIESPQSKTTQASLSINVSYT